MNMIISHLIQDPLGSAAEIIKFLMGVPQKEGYLQIPRDGGDCAMQDYLPTLQGWPGGFPLIFL